MTKRNGHVEHVEQLIKKKRSFEMCFELTYCSRMDVVKEINLETRCMHCRGPENVLKRGSCFRANCLVEGRDMSVVNGNRLRM